jgi:hypothetical protein
VPLLCGLFWFTPGGDLCTYPPPIAASRFTDFIALACPGETWFSHMPLLRVYIQVSASGRSSTLSPLDHAVTSRRQSLQHCAAKHCFKCSECDEEFVTESARDQVHHLVISWSSTDIITPSALQRHPPLGRVPCVRSRIQDPGGDGSGLGSTFHSAVAC